MRNFYFSLLGLFLFIGIQAQSPGTLDTTFNSTDIGFGNGDGVNDEVFTTSVQSDGKILIGGDFTSYNGTSVNNIARLNSDGSLDTNFNIGTGVNGEVFTTSVQSDGKILIGGDFTSYNGTSVNNIARLNSDGSLDTSFNIGTGANDEVFTASVQSDGKILIGGDFTSYNGTSVNNIARLNSDGSLDTSFNIGTGLNNRVSTISVQSDGKILLGGSFTSYNDTSVNYIARLNSNGSLDTSFNIGTGANNTVSITFVQNDGKILISGGLSNYNGSSVNGIARLNSDGSLDTSFNVGTGTNGEIETISVQSDGKILIGGWFIWYNGTFANHIARLNSNGSLDTSFNVGTGTNYGGVYTTSIQSDGKTLIGGVFTSYNGLLVGSLARLNSNGSLDTNFNIGTGANGEIEATFVQSDGKILIGGDFTSYNGLLVGFLARLNSNGSLDTNFNMGTGANGEIETISVQSDGKILIGGDFTSYNGTFINYLARLNSDGSLDTSFNMGTGLNNRVSTISVQSDGKILIGGWFSSYNDTSVISIARLNSDGSLDTSFNIGTGADNEVETIFVQSDGKILIGGYFTSYNGTSANYIARLNSDGSLDTSFNMGTGANSEVLTISVQSDGKILIGGWFSNYNGISTNYLARLNSDGSLDTSFNMSTGASSAVLTILIQNDGKIIIGGYFYSYNDTSVNYIARLKSDGSLDTSFNMGSSGTNNGVSIMSIQSDNKLIIGGYFTSYNGIGRNRIARIHTGDALSIKDITKASKAIQVYNNNNLLIITHKKGSIESVTLFDITGKRIYKKTEVNSSVLELPTINIKNQLLILKVKDENDAISTKKVLVN